jgi:uncharacterized protein (UPF0248 family)
MIGGPLREVLNRLRWDAGEAAAGAWLAYRLRAGGEERDVEVSFTAVVAILPLGLTLADGTFLPYHRIVAVRRGGEVLWQSKRQ